MRNDIDIALGEENHVGKAVEISKTGGAVFDDLENTIDALADSVGQWALDEGNDIGVMNLQRTDKSAHGGKTAFQRRRHPLFKESLCRGQVVIAPEVIKLVFKNPGTMNATI